MAAGAQVWTLIGVIIAGGVVFAVDTRSGMRRMGDKLEGKIDALDVKFEAKIDALGEKGTDVGARLGGEIQHVRGSLDVLVAQSHTHQSFASASTVSARPTA